MDKLKDLLINNQLKNSVESEAQIPMAIESLERNVKFLEEANSKLFARFAPVLSPSKPRVSQTGNVGEVSVIDVPLADKISGLSNRVAGLSNELCDLLQRCGL